MKKKQQDIRLAITEKGDRYFQELVSTGFTALPTWEQRTEWDVLHDLILYGRGSEGVRLTEFFVERPTTIIGRKFLAFSEGEKGQMAKESYGRTLRRLITEGYIKSWIHQPEVRE